MRLMRPSYACAREPDLTRRPIGRGHHGAVPDADRRRATPVIRDHHRLKGGAAQLGATGPGQPGPFGVWPADDRDGQDQEPADDNPTTETRTA
ncbi:hypothetical protein [Streptomyces graminilatus]|uniref:hypothetical protein n=1 Tax=Streptomyces graminilatus TaxID=1464070 RepID=UPI000AA704C3|nr:hypothetical protein [Streptomyces graminilatus]